MHLRKNSNLILKILSPLCATLGLDLSLTIIIAYKFPKQESNRRK